MPSKDQPEAEIIDLWGIPVKALRGLPGLPEGRLYVPADEALPVLRALKQIGIDMMGMALGTACNCEGCGDALRKEQISREAFEQGGRIICHGCVEAMLEREVIA